MIEIKQLKKRYGERTVLDIESLRAEPGETVAFAGANGSGKTTLLRILAGLTRTSEGTVHMPEKVLYMPQQCYAFRGTLIQNIRLTGADEQRAKAALEAVQLAQLANKKARSLSGGELQRLALCRLLVQECEVLLLDEPTSACDAQGAQLMMQAIEQYHREHNCTVLMSTHSPLLAANAADRLILLHDGKAVADGKPKEILAHPESAWAKSFIAGWRIEC